MVPRDLINHHSESAFSSRAYSPVIIVKAANSYNLQFINIYFNRTRTMFCRRNRENMHNIID